MKFYHVDDHNFQTYLIFHSARSLRFGLKLIVYFAKIHRKYLFQAFFCIAFYSHFTFTIEYTFITAVGCKAKPKPATVLILKTIYHSFSEPNVYIDHLQMELCRSANIFAAP